MKNEGFNNQFFYYLSFIGYLGLNFIVGFPIASFLFINGFILFHNKRDYKFSILISIILMLVLWFLSSMLTLQFPNGVIGMFVNLPWWLGWFIKLIYIIKTYVEKAFQIYLF